MPEIDIAIRKNWPDQEAEDFLSVNVPILASKLLGIEKCPPAVVYLRSRTTGIIGIPWKRVYVCAKPDLTRMQQISEVTYNYARRLMNINASSEERQLFTWHLFSEISIPLILNLRVSPYMACGYIDNFDESQDTPFGHGNPHRLQYLAQLAVAVLFPQRGMSLLQNPDQTLLDTIALSERDDVIDIFTTSLESDFIPALTRLAKDVLNLEPSYVLR